jgi:hypothetical protein
MTLKLSLDADGNPVRRDHRVTSVALCLVAATLLTAACLSKRWLANGTLYHSVTYSLTRYTECQEGQCETRPTTELPELLRSQPPEPISVAFAPAGWITLGGSALAIVSLLACAIFGLFRRRVALPVAPTSLALLSLFVALIAGCVFIATKPGRVGRVGVDWGFVVFGAAVVSGIVAAQRIDREIRPLDPDLGEHEMMMLDRM